MNEGRKTIASELLVGKGAGARSRNVGMKSSDWSQERKGFNREQPMGKEALKNAANKPFFNESWRG